MSEKSVEIKEICIGIGKKQIILSVEDAKKLKGALEELFGVKVITKEEHHHYDRVYDKYPYPYWHYENTRYLCSGGNAELEYNEKASMVLCSLK